MEQAPTPIKNVISMTSLNNNEYSIEIQSETKSIIITISTKNKIPSLVYQDHFSYEVIKKNKYFSICDSISEIMTTLSPIIKEKKIKLVEKEKEIELIVSLPHPLCPQISFNVKEKQVDGKESINEIYELINSLTKTVEKQQKVIEDQNKVIKNLEEKIKKIEEEKQIFTEIKNNYLLKKEKKEKKN